MIIMNSSIVLIVIIVLILIIPTDVFAYPIPFGTQGTSVTTIKLKIPEYDVLTSDFDSTGEITVDIKFENKGSSPEGLIWSNESIDETIENFDEIYERLYYDRYVAIDIHDITDSVPIK